MCGSDFYSKLKIVVHIGDVALDKSGLCESKSVNSNFRTSMISIILRRMPSFGIRPY